MSDENLFESALCAYNASYLESQYLLWLDNASSVNSSLAAMFVEVKAGGGQGREEKELFAASPEDAASKGAALRGEKREEMSECFADDSVRAMQLIRAYRVRGHLEAQLDPLGLRVPPTHKDLDPETYGFRREDLERPIHLGSMASALLAGRTHASIHELLAVLRTTYCGPIGVEYMHIQDPVRRAWLQDRLEGDDWRRAFSAPQKTELLRQLIEAEGFETFCHKRYTGTKRFGLEGSEIAIPVLHTIIRTSAENGVQTVSLGMAHRGRLNAMANIVQKPFAAIFTEFAGASFKPHDVQGSGDVKYHLGTATVLNIDGRDVRIILLPNPSHLEAVDPVVVGRVRALQDLDDNGSSATRYRHLGLLVHGDAAFAGQGVAYETLAMSQLVGYRTGGTIHVVINNQIGFTTISAHTYSGLYCTDIAKAVQAPILHVNGDEPEAAAYCARLAADYRREFGADIVLDLVCYRRHGHNEADEPAFTQPVMYKAIAARASSVTLYAKRLTRENVLAETDVAQMCDAFEARMETEFEIAKTYQPRREDWLDCRQDPTRLADDPPREQPQTGISPEKIQKIGGVLTEIPPDFSLHSRLSRWIAARRRALTQGEGLDWALCEALAFGSLLLEGHRVRLSGEDCQRGTFSQRHAVLVDQVNHQEYTPLNHIDPSQAKLDVFNSLLSEFGVLGFEYGYSLAAPDSLVLWEAQFGDFANGAQVIIDQFIASGETKWLRASGLVLLLPHGLEGHGPEHSSARLERYLQLCGENNLRVCVPTTPANYFHALRRQIARACRKPLVLLSPKSFLRHKDAVSTVRDIADGTSFQPVIAGTAPDESAVTRVILVSGKLYYDLNSAIATRALSNIVIIRLEQLYPFPRKELGEVLARYLDAEIIWCQEEPKNAGAWLFLDRRIEETARGVGHRAPRPKFIGRAGAASTATGLHSEHEAQQNRIIADALSDKELEN